MAFDRDRMTICGRAYVAHCASGRELHNVTEAGVSFGPAGPGLTSSTVANWALVRNGLGLLIVNPQWVAEHDRVTIYDVAYAWAIAHEACL